MTIEVKNISKKVENKDVIKDITFSIFNNEIVALVGPNGAGKTTILKMITGLIKSSNGSITIDKRNIVNEREKVLKEISFMQDSSVLYSDLTGYEHLNFVAKFRGIPTDKITEIIEDLGLKEYAHIPVKKYSLGMKQLLLLSIAILTKPKFLLLDEPLNGLDPSATILFRKKILALRSEGTSVLFSSHVLSEVDKVANRILFINEGRIIKELEVSSDVSKKNFSYLFEVKEPEKVISILNNKFFIKQLNLDGKYLLEITLDTPDLRTIIKTIYSNNLEIIDIVKTEFHTESIYHDLYGDRYKNE